MSKIKGIPLDEINLDSLLSDELGVDSLDLVEIAMELEEYEREIIIPEEVAQQFKSVRDVIEYLRQRLKQHDEDKS